MKIQQAFDKMVSHLAQQGKQAYDNDTEKCLYRTKDDLKCVVGCLLSEEAYAEIVLHDQTTARVNFILRRIPIVQQELALDDNSNATSFYGAMQHAHDSSRDKEHLIRELESIASLYELDPEKISTIQQWET